MTSPSYFEKLAQLAWGARNNADTKVGIESIFHKYNFEPTIKTQQDLAKYLGGNTPWKTDKMEFRGWPVAAVGGSFAQELAIALDYKPSTWVLESELEDIKESRKLWEPKEAFPGGLPKDKAWKAGLLGLAFSGGGIRSATFNLGILQGLAKLGMLRSFDYLSTVSGGGYIGSWFINWIKRNGLKEVESGLNPDLTTDPADFRLEPIRFLRDFSNYLTPKMGLLSADLWVAGVMWFRNTLLNLLVLLPALFALLVVPRSLELWSKWFGENYVKGAGVHPSPYELVVLLLCVLWAFVLVVLNLRKFPAGRDDADTNRTAQRQRFYSRPWGVLVFIVAFIFGAAWLASLELWLYAGQTGPWEWRSVGAVAAIMTGTLLWSTNYSTRFRMIHGLSSTVSKGGEGTARGGSEKTGTVDGLLSAWRAIDWTAVSARAAMIGIAAAIGAVAALLTEGVENIFAFWRSSDSFPGRPNAAAMTVFGVPLVVFSLFFVFILMVGFTSRNLPEGASNWLVRVRAYLVIYCVIWVGWFGVSIYGPRLDFWLRNFWYAKWSVIAAWAWTTAKGVLAGNSSETSGGKSDWKTSLGFYATVAPYVFIGGLLLALSLGAQSSLIAMTEGLRAGEPSWLSKLYPFAQSGHEWAWSVLLCFVFAALLAFILSICFGINEFSLNGFYRDRLVRCYLGATNNKRHPDPFTGFDPRDDQTTLASLQPGPCQNLKYEGPFPIFNATLNLVHGDELAWQERKGASFTFTPGFCGYETPWHASANPQPFKKLEFVGYRKTEEFANLREEMNLGTAISISGAALSPNMGFYSRAATAFLMTIFNVRLGRWLGNPRHKKTWHRAGPTQGLAYLTKELLGFTSDRAGFIYVSDGGHFENLAIYELLRRRCRFIVACDAEEDVGFAFNGLGNAIRKCREDFGVEIDLGVDLIKPDPTTGLSRSHCVVGKIRYPGVPPGDFGYLVYIKASISGDEPEDVLQYRTRHSSFPHQSTGDQWFTESQFESYRKLGLHIAETTFSCATEDIKKRLGQDKHIPHAGIPEVFKQLGEYWYPPSKAIQENFTKHANALDELVREMRSDTVLLRLDTVVIPAENVPQPRIKDADKPKMLLFLSSVIQLMENIYLDLDLERNAEHPQVLGWMKIFKAWTKSEIFREAWNRYGWSYGPNFQRFCSRNLDLAVRENRDSC